MSSNFSAYFVMALLATSLHFTSLWRLITWWSSLGMDRVMLTMCKSPF